MQRVLYITVQDYIKYLRILIIVYNACVTQYMCIINLWTNVIKDILSFKCFHIHCISGFDSVACYN